MRTVRAIAHSLLNQWEENGSYINLSLGKATEGLSDGDRRFLTALTYGVVERCITLDYHIGSLTKGTSLTPSLRNLLRMGLYELVFLNTPAHAAVNETVKLARHKGEASLLNGVLRRVAREPACISLPPREKNLARYLSIAHSVPLPTVKRLMTMLGEDTEGFLQSINEKAPLTLRVNTLKVTVEDYLEKLEEIGISAVPTPYSPYGVRVLTDIPIPQLYGFEEGLFFVQDEASQISSLVLSPQAGETLIDICACPGGKSFGAAMLMGNTGEILSLDLHSSKLSLIEEGAKRLELTIITAQEQDGTIDNPLWHGCCVRIICDVPCSGLGVFGKKADLRYKDISTLDNLPTLQSQILQVASGYLKEGGILLYSTCTINPAENRGVVDAFLSSHPDFHLVPFSVGDLVADTGDLTLYPHRHHTDGFYIAKLERSRL